MGQDDAQLKYVAVTPATVYTARSVISNIVKDVPYGTQVMIGQCEDYITRSVWCEVFDSDGVPQGYILEYHLRETKPKPRRRVRWQ